MSLSPLSFVSSSPTRKLSPARGAWIFALFGLIQGVSSGCSDDSSGTGANTQLDASSDQTSGSSNTVGETSASNHTNPVTDAGTTISDSTDITHDADTTAAEQPDAGSFDGDATAVSDAATEGPGSDSGDSAVGDSGATESDAAVNDASSDEPLPGSEDAATSNLDASGPGSAVGFSDVQAVFETAGCGRTRPGGGLTTCHSTDNAVGVIDLLGVNAFDNLVDVESSLYPGNTLVVPGNADESFLMRKLLNDLPDDVSLGEPMPLGEGIRWSALPDDQLQVVRDWIESGASR